MAEETADAAPESSKGSFDLNSLSGLNFGPDWADGRSPSKPDLKRFEGRDDRKGKGKRPGNQSRDRRSGGRPQRERSNDSRERRDGPRERYQGGEHRRGQQRNSNRPPFEPSVKVDLYPQDEAFDALIARLRASARTYQLFEIAHLLLEKPERYVVVVAPKAKKSDEKEEKPILYFSVPGHLPFESEEQAISHVVKEHMDLFFEIEEVEVEPPSGNFQMVNRCSLTGELLGPPNYHRYQEFVQQHYNSRITGMSFDRFLSKVEGTKEQEDIDAWLESMKKGARYTVKDRKEGEPEVFDTLESARHFLIMHRKDQVVKSGESVRFAGRDIERLPKGSIRRSVEIYIDQQKHFPLDSANNIRGRLRRHKFAVYKKGSKGVSYVCAVKRRFRDNQTVFTDSIRGLIQFIERNPEIAASKLPKEYIGIDTEKQRPEELKMKEPAVETEAPADAPAEDARPAESSTEAKPKVELPADEQQKLNQLMMDLRWLITEGYVTEYGDGRLFAPAPLPESKKKEEAPANASEPKATEVISVPEPSTEGPTQNETAAAVSETKELTPEPEKNEPTTPEVEKEATADVEAEAPEQKSE